MIIQVEHAVSNDDCLQLMAIYDRQAHLTNARDHTGQPVVYWEQFREVADAAEIVPRLVEQCLGTLRDLARCQRCELRATLSFLGQYVLRTGSSEPGPT